MATTAFRVVANGAMLEVVNGTSPDGKTERTSTAIHREGEIITKPLAKGFVERYDSNEEYARSLVERVEDSGETDDQGNIIWVATGAPASDSESAPPASDAEAVARVEAAEKEAASLRSQVSGTQEELDKAQARVSELEAQVEEAEQSAATSITYNDLSKEALEAEVAKKDVSVTGTGSGGNVVKTDLVSALEAKLQGDRSSDS